MTTEAEESERTFKQEFRKHAVFIGLFFNNWGAVEAQLRLAFSFLLRTDRLRATIIFSEFQALGVKLNLMRRLTNTHYVDGDGKNALLRLIGDTQRLSDRRNLYAHSTWAHGPDPRDTGGPIPVGGTTTIPVKDWKVLVVPGTTPNDKEVMLAPPFAISAEDIQEDCSTASALNDRWIAFFRDHAAWMEESEQVKILRGARGQKARTDQSSEQ
jgi:hypothetical protein